MSAARFSVTVSFTGGLCQARIHVDWDGIPLIYHDLIFEWHPKIYSRLGFIDPGSTWVDINMFDVHDP